MGLIVAAGMTSSYFLVNGIIVVVTFWKDIIWAEVRQILPLAAVGSIFGALFLSQINPIILLVLMLYFALSFLYKGVIKDEQTKKESKLSIWTMSLLSGFLAGTALPGGGLRNSYLLSKGYTIPQMHSTTNFIGAIAWSLKLIILLEASVLNLQNLKAVLIAIPLLILSNFLLRKGLLNISKQMSKKISIFAMGSFSVYAMFIIIKALF